MSYIGSSKRKGILKRNDEKPSFRFKKLGLSMPTSDNTAVKFTGYHADPIQVQVRLPKRHPIPGKDIIPEPPPEQDKVQKEGDMYPLKWPSYTHSDVEKKIKSVLEPLSLFTAYGDDEDAEGKPRVELERPNTPINEEIRQQPTSLEQLAKFVRRRIKARPDDPYLSIDDQQNLAGILMGEINLIWPEIRKQIDDPFLSPEQNKELNRRIAVHIVTVCEELFNHYTKKAQVLNQRGIFSGPANMSRLKAQLALDANKFFNILTIRRYIVEDIRKQATDGDTGEDVVYSASPEKPVRTKSDVPVLSFKGMIQTSRPKSKVKRYRFHTPEQEAKQIVDNMPSLDTNKVLGLLTDLPERDLETPSEASEGKASRISDREKQTSGVSKEDLSRRKVLLKRSRSLPDIQFGETLLEELGIDRSIKKDVLAQYEIDILKRQMAQQKVQQSKQKIVVDASKKPQPGTREYAAQDLQRLVKRPQDTEDPKIKEDLPPLLQAITRSAKHDGLKERLEQRMKELEEKERQDIKESSVNIREPTHPQPSTVSARLPGMEVRASDIRVSERVCMSSITIDGYTTVYNELTDEIDPATVKSLDKNLFLSDEIKEVYREIMKTVPTDHLRLDDDEMVQKAADDVNLSGTMASSTLAKRRSQRVINPALNRGQKAPWGEMDPKQWVRTPHNPPKNFLGEDTFHPTFFPKYKTPNMEKIHDFMHNPRKMAQIKEQTENMPKFVAEKMSRTYASWLQWWRSTITSDDYMKYLSTTESDYMGVVFHFYDSEDEDEEEEEEPTPRGYTIPRMGMSPFKPHSRAGQPSKLAELKEREKKIEELKQEKNKYEEGMWNVNSILMGGLGKDPVLTEPQDDDDASSSRKKSADTTKSAKTLQERAAARHSAKLEKAGREVATTSRASKVTTITGTISKLETDRTEESGEVQLTPQERLEKVWGSLEMPDNLKLDMAIKYSTNDYYVKLYEAIEHWEKVTDLILKREDLLAKLEKFERAASDPNRFFEKGNKGSSVKRLQEAKQRSYLYKRIEYYDHEIKVELTLIKKHFKDEVSYKGRPYEEKIKWDRIEMLYWLQEERKSSAIKYESMMKPFQVGTARLEPIPNLPQEGWV
ncbi:coiled-coil domain-containing protein 87-like isoform X3 [Saccostrea echinata]|uniref:coiled-coil domain-containing protein 87-like isoform X3 n=1 Tax=Saccostrea echinata TaxID=191078 RepID=UPI002A813DC5|nr:coiled-coil domain-containing protein 87-like isoform X3 [Saccostrea echinata]